MDSPGLNFQDDRVLRRRRLRARWLELVSRFFIGFFHNSQNCTVHFDSFLELLFGVPFAPFWSSFCSFLELLFGAPFARVRTYSRARGFEVGGSGLVPGG